MRSFPQKSTGQKWRDNFHEGLEKTVALKLLYRRLPGPRAAEIFFGPHHNSSGKANFQLREDLFSELALFQPNGAGIVFFAPKFVRS